jgi:MFS family permease
MSGAYVPLVSTVARWFVKKRGMMTGLAVSGLGLGTLIMPLVANWLISNHGWRFSFRVVGAVALVIVPLTAQLLRRDPGRMRQLPCGAGE